MVRYLVIGLSVALFSGGNAYAQEDASYSYDALGRLRTVTRDTSASKTVSTYTLDKADNRQSVSTVYTGNTSCALSATEGVARISVNASGSGSARVDVEGVCSGPIVVSFVATDGSAIHGLNYSPSSGTITISPGESSKFLSFTAYLADSDSKHFSYTISVASGNATIKVPSASFGIYAD